MKKGNKINMCVVYVLLIEENIGCEISEIFFFIGFIFVVDSCGLSFMLIVLVDVSLYFNIKLFICCSLCIKICMLFKR